MRRFCVYCVLRWRVFAACLAAALTVLLSQGGGGLGGPRVVSSPEDLRDALREAQWGLLPLEAAVLYDAGDMLFLPDGGDGDAFLLALLLSTEDWEGAEVTVSEDAGTRETLFHNPDGHLFWTLPPEEDYTPWWAAGLLFPEGMPGWVDPGWYDPSLAGVRVSLWPLAFPDIPDAQDAPAQGEAPFPGQGGGVQGVLPPGEGAQAALPGNDPPPPEGRTNALDTAGATLLPAAPREVEVRAVIYVDAARGDDAWTGRSALSRGGGEGPKRTVAAGMAAAAGGGRRLVIGEGVYPESLDVRGTGVRVTFTGDVALGNAAARRMRHGDGAGTAANTQN